MKIAFPSQDFDHAVAAVCHGSASEEQMQALNALLHASPAARDEYILRLELHSRLASEPDLFARGTEVAGASRIAIPGPGARRLPRAVGWALAVAACLALLAAGWGVLRFPPAPGRKGDTSKAVAMLNRVVEAEWRNPAEAPRPGAPLEPGWLQLKSGLVQIVFYSGARVGIEGPAEFQLVSPGEMVCRSGRLVAEVPPAAKGFQVRTPRLNVIDLGTVFGVEAGPGRTELHVFKGTVELQPVTGAASQRLLAGEAAVAGADGAPRGIPASADGFASLFDLHNKASEAEVLRHEQWRAASRRLDEDPSLLVHLDFEAGTTPDWRLPNASQHRDAAGDAAVVGCLWTEGRWPEKQALEFRGVSDRVRVGVPGEFQALTLAAWLRVQGLDRQINSLFMSDGFEPGTVHWCIRQDGVLGLTAIGPEPGRYQICASPPVLTLDQFGLWVHVAVVIDGAGRQVTHYLNGTLVGGEALKIRPPFRIGAAELGNWHARGLGGDDPFLIRNFSGAMDEFCLFSRALSTGEIRALYATGKPHPDSPGPSRR